MPRRTTTAVTRDELLDVGIGSSCGAQTDTKVYWQSHPDWRRLVRVGSEGTSAEVSDELRSVLDTLSCLVWTASPEGQVDSVNRRWCEYTGVSFEESCARWHEAIHAEDFPRLFEEWQRVLASGESGEVEARLRRFDGQYRRFLIRASPLRDATGRIVKWYGVNTDIEDQTRAQHALRGRALDLRTVLDSCPIPVALLSAAGELEAVNRHVEEYYGRSVEELKNWERGDLIHPDDRGHTAAAWWQACETGSPYELEHRCLRGDGAYRWVQVRGLPLRDTEGRVARWVVVHTDVDNRKRAEALLADENRLLEMIARGCSLPVLLAAVCELVEKSMDGCHCSVLLVDSAAKFRHGAAPSLPSGYNEFIDGQPIRCDVGPCAMAATLKTQVIAADLEADSRWSAEWRDMALSLGLRSCWSTPIFSVDLKVLGTFAIYQHDPRTPTSLQQDLIQQFTQVASIAIERARGEAALKQSEAFLAQAQSLSSTGSFSWNLSTREITWSQELYRLFELDPSLPVTLERISSQVHPDDLPVVEEMFRKASDDGSDFEYEHRLLMSDDSVKYLHVLAHATRNRDGQLVYIGAAQDITERRLSEQALDKVRSELTRVARATSLGVLTASIAHEVNQPLSGVITNASTCLRMLGADPPNVEGALETARRTIRDGNRAADVISRLRALFGKQGDAAESVDLNEAARDVIALSSGELQRQRVTIHAELDARLPPITGDRVQLQQVILNLLLNAMEAMNEVQDRPRTVWVRTERESGDRVRLSVKDSGVGFDHRDSDRFFEAFYTTKDGGMGIGLSVSRSIIERHHGRLWAVPNDGPGATFSFSIPRVPDVGAETLVLIPAATAPKHAPRNP